MSGADGTDITFTFDSFQPQSAPEVCDQDGRPHERLSGVYVPMRLRFINAAWMRKIGIYEEFDSLPQGHNARQVFGVQRSYRPTIRTSFTGLSLAPTSQESFPYRLRAASSNLCLDLLAQLRC